MNSQSIRNIHIPELLPCSDGIIPHPDMASRHPPHGQSLCGLERDAHGFVVERKPRSSRLRHAVSPHQREPTSKLQLGGGPRPQSVTSGRNEMRFIADAFTARTGRVIHTYSRITCSGRFILSPQEMKAAYRLPDGYH